MVAASVEQWSNRTANAATFGKLNDLSGDKALSVLFTRWMIRGGTALLILALCVPAVIRGWDILWFSRAEVNGEDTRPWASVSGLTFSALESSLTVLADSADKAQVAKRREDIIEVLSIRPMASEYWLTLAGIRIMADEPLSKALEALTLSTVTGPNEGYLITQRGIFGISFWEILPPEVRNRALTELTARRLSGRNAERVRAIIAAKKTDVRQNIRAALQARGFSAGEFARIGL